MRLEPSRLSSLHRFSLWSVFFLMICIIVGLATLNVMTLSSAWWHDRAYAHLSAASDNPLIRTATSDRSSRWLKKSKTESIHAEVDRQTRQIRGEYAELVVKATAAQVALAAASRTIESLEKDKVLIGRDRDSYKARHAKVEADHAAFKAKAGELSKSYAQRTAKAVSRRIATAAGQVVPFAGAAVTATLMAIDVQEACQSVKDLQSLSGPDAVGQSWISEACQSTPTAPELVRKVKSGWNQAYTSAMVYMPNLPQLSVSESAIMDILKTVSW